MICRLARGNFDAERTETAGLVWKCRLFAFSLRLARLRARRSTLGFRAHLRAMLDALLRAAVGAAGSVRRGVGAGRLVEFRGKRARGSALVAEGQVVHVAVL